MMKIVIAPDSFKGTLSASDAASALSEGIRDVLGNDVNVVVIPLADGGEGTVQAVLLAQPSATTVNVRVCGPLGKQTMAAYALLDQPVRTAVIEMAAAAGLTIVPPQLRHPTNTTTYGVGELIVHACEVSHAQRVIVGLGGSATNDGGAGALQALGARFVDGGGRVVSCPATGGTLAEIGDVDEARRLLGEPCEFVLACDVTNPLVGANGASAVYGPQKGLQADEVGMWDQRLERFAVVLEHVAKLRGGTATAQEIASQPAGGAAGGLAAGLMAWYPNAIVRPGVDLVTELAGFRKQASDADWLITGEGALDSQTLSGKAVIGVLREVGSPAVIIIAGRVDHECSSLIGDLSASHVASLVDRFGEAEAVGNTAACLRAMARELCRKLIIGGQVNATK
jgi:glycerate kinase